MIKKHQEQNQNNIKLVIDKRYEDFLFANYIEFNKINLENIPSKNYINSTRDYLYYNEELNTYITMNGKDIIKILTIYRPKKFYE